MTIFSKNLGGYDPFGPPGYADADDWATQWFHLLPGVTLTKRVRKQRLFVVHFCKVIRVSANMNALLNADSMWHTRADTYTAGLAHRAGVVS